MNSQLDEARRKGATGSRQEEGFTQQDLFAEELRRRFPGDEITVTPRGMAGADVAQVVRLGGHDCGVILWECKRAANWSGTWVGELADDVAKVGADLGVIVSEELPSGMTSSGRSSVAWWSVAIRVWSGSGTWAGALALAVRMSQRRSS